ncbi:MAG: hypothetical protein VXW70_01375 [Candidatus Thermoplasmatota archaeon]|nr:hypothetical protein [Candidatus Thermoplasmatota archaeon]MEC7255494.1 hypothetical protein [Candidatus Thermoplasmatota archaeon]MEC8249130.1 hypothetical protein [Candidatus Thermoplasmatota archaeon]MEC8257714.1 hypothetical protein [Candidatus Thermoplasmatota archaeon]MEC8353282.1 hypothetical protein [Candidatus Thermoplasmatota archaeon]
MARKKRRIGKILGAIAGSPYERLLKQVDKLVETSVNERMLAKNLEKLVSITAENYDEEKIDEEEHDLIIEAIEEADPEGRTFPKMDEDEDPFYMGDVPDAPVLKGKKRQNLDQLMKAKGNEFTGSFGRDEFEEYKSRMAQEFLKDSDKAIREGDHVANIGTINRVFADVDEDISRVKQEITEETGMLDPNAEDGEEYPEGYSIDEDGTEWFEDEDGYWWYRLEGDEDWQPYEE